jgi:hypothetical protein
MQISTIFSYLYIINDKSVYFSKNVTKYISPSSNERQSQVKTNTLIKNE